MNGRILALKLAWLCPVLLLVATGAKANTITVDYYTKGVFCGATDSLATCSASTSTSISSGTNASLSFTSADPGSFANTDAGSFGLPLGTFTATRTGSPNYILPTSQFLLLIYQALPSAGDSAGQLLASFSGGVKQNGSIDFGNTSAVIGAVTYQLTGLATGGILDVSTGNSALTKTSALSATVTHSDPAPVVPEPASVLLLGTGLFGIAAGARRRRNRARASNA